MPLMLLAGLALAEDPGSWNDDYLNGYHAGQLQGEQVDCREFLGYGAAAGCVGGCAGCIGLTVTARYVDPGGWKPVRGDVVPPRNDKGTVPSAPADVDAAQWQQGYEEGWDEAVQKARARQAFAGGSITVGIAAVGIATYYVAAVALVVGVGF